jgi:alkanesulfonate monooxygenase SsuD/methylene tetrahydromethanopterin reductase-like flavin-dependent oxidoreductase (luciferase family)
VLVGGSAEAAIRRAARLADGIFSNAPVEKLVQIVGWVRDELDRAGRDPATFRLAHYSVLLPGPSWAEALARYADALWAMNWKYADMEASARRHGAPPPPPPTPDVEALVKGRAVFAGTPESIVESLLALRERAGMPVDFVARGFLSLLPHDDQLELMHALAEGVAPHV